MFNIKKLRSKNLYLENELVKYKILLEKRELHIFDLQDKDSLYSEYNNKLAVIRKEYETKLITKDAQCKVDVANALSRVGEAKAQAYMDVITKLGLTKEIKSK